MGRTGTKWKAGDTVGCLLDMLAGTMLFTLNGKVRWALAQCPVDQTASVDGSCARAQDPGMAFMDVPREGEFFPAIQIANGAYKFRLGTDVEHKP